MSKLFKKDNGIRWQQDDLNTGLFTTIPYETSTVLTVIGTDINVQSPIDPTPLDFLIDWTQVISPVTATPQELVDLMYCWISDELPNVITMLTDTPVVFEADCNALQNFGNDLYWRGQLLSTGGGTGISTVDNGLSENPAGNAQLGGQITQPTTVELVDANSFQITSPLTVGGNTSFYMFPIVPDQGIVGLTGSGGIFQIDSATIKMIAPFGSSLQLRTSEVSGSTRLAGQVLTLTDAVTGAVEYTEGLGSLQVQSADPQILTFGNLKNWFFYTPSSIMELPDLSAYGASTELIEASFYNNTVTTTPTTCTIRVSAGSGNGISGMANGTLISGAFDITIDPGYWVTLVGIPQHLNWYIKSYNA